MPSRTNMRTTSLTSGISSFLLIATLLFAGSALAQQAPGVSQQAPSGPQLVTRPQDATKESLTINSGDLLHITVFDAPELEQRVRVNDAGIISLSMIGSIKVAGLTPFEAARVLHDKYIAGDYLKNPQVSILVEEYAGQNVSVLGEVNKPGGIPLVTPKSLLDVIAMAGGFTPLADRHITVQRRNPPSERIAAFISNNSDSAFNQSAVMVYPGDTIIVPKAPIVYVLGDVSRPGGYPMENESQMTVLQSIAAAGGTTKTASENKTRLLRRTGDGPNYAEQRLSVKDMEKGKVADIQLQPNDIVYVPFSWGRNVAIGATSIMASATSAVIYTKP